MLERFLATLDPSLRSLALSLVSAGVTNSATFKCLITLEDEALESVSRGIGISDHFRRFFRGKLRGLRESGWALQSR